MKELGIDNFYIELYELFPCNSKNELEQREGEIIRLIGTLNEKVAGRDKKQYYFENIDKIKTHREQHYIENREAIREKQHQYAIKTKQDKKNYDKEYREINKERIKERKTTTLFVCECGCEVKKEGKANHLRTEKHNELMALKK